MVCLQKIAKLTNYFLNFIKNTTGSDYLNISGKTPLMRAKNLEHQFNVGEIYLKLEGANPYGHKYDRMAEVIIRSAKQKGKRNLLIDGSLDYILSMLSFAKKEGLHVSIPIFKHESWKRNALPEEILIDFTKESLAKKREVLEKYRTEYDLYEISNGVYNHNLSVVSLSKIGEEIVDKLGNDISTVFTQLSYGYTVSGLFNGLLDKWVSGELTHYPKIYSCTIPHGNFIYDDYKKEQALPKLNHYDIKANKYTRDLFTEESDLLQETLKAIQDTGGNLLSIEEDLLKESVRILKKEESILLSTEEGYAFAGFYKMVKGGKLQKGKHVIVLNDAKSDMELILVKDFNTYSMKTLGGFIEDWLQNYKDPMDETYDAMNHAIKDGFILLALRNKMPQGISVVVQSGFENFFPTYHLSYIATKEGNKGRGIGTTLMSEMLSLTGGNLSLHVDLENKRAKTLYEKMGFKAKYYRMIHKADEV